MRNNQNRKYLYSLADIYKIVAVKINNSKQVPVLSSSKPLDIDNCYILDIPFIIKEMGKFQEKSLPPPQNISLLQNLFSFLRRGASVNFGTSNHFFLIVILMILIIFKQYIYILISSISKFIKTMV